MGGRKEEVVDHTVATVARETLVSHLVESVVADSGGMSLTIEEVGTQLQQQVTT